MAEMSLGEFKERYGEHSAIAELAVIVEDEANDKKQIIHNATGHKLRSPGAREKKRLLREQQKKGDTARSEGARLPWLPGGRRGRGPWEPRCTDCVRPPSGHRGPLLCQLMARHGDRVPHVQARALPEARYWSPGSAR